MSHGGFRRARNVWRDDIVMADRLSEQLEGPDLCAITESEGPKGSGDLNCDTFHGRADGDLQGRAPLHGVQCVDHEPLEGGSVIPRTNVLPYLVRDRRKVEPHVEVVGTFPPAECVVETVSISRHLEDWSWV